MGWHLAPRTDPVTSARDRDAFCLAGSKSAATRRKQERLDDERLVASLDGCNPRTFAFEGDTVLGIRGAFYTLGLGGSGRHLELMLPMDASHLP